MTTDASQIKRFDRSFLILMVRDFFLLLVLVIFIELVLRFGLVVYTFQNEEKQMTEQAAARIANDVTAIMLNSGGPVAASTLYPMLKKSNEEMGLVIAITPSQATIDTISANFDYRPRGIPAQWPEGAHQSATVEIRAEEFCVSCHSTAVVGDVLGQVTVRRYLSSDITKWWEEVRLVGLFGLMKTIIHTVLLYSLLYCRMEPLLSLRAVVARLAKAGAHLSFRAEVRSADEFGELAQNLNLFLDRISQVVEDLNDILGKIGVVNHNLAAVQGRIGVTLGEMERGAEQLRLHGDKKNTCGPLLTAEWAEAVDFAFDALRMIESHNVLAPSFAERSQTLSERLKAAVCEAEIIVAREATIVTAADKLFCDVTTFRAAVAEMTALEEQMIAISEQGQTLVKRLLPEDEESANSYAVT